MFEIITDFFQREYILIITITIGVIIEFISRSIKRKMKRSIFSQYDRSTDPEHGEYYLEYYRKSQIIDVVRVISFIVMIAVVISVKTSSGVNLFVVAAGHLSSHLRIFSSRLSPFSSYYHAIRSGIRSESGNFRVRLFLSACSRSGFSGKITMAIVRGSSISSRAISSSAKRSEKKTSTPAVSENKY